MVESKSESSLLLKSIGFLKQCLHDLQLTQFGGTFIKLFKLTSALFGAKFFGGIEDKKNLLKFPDLYQVCTSTSLDRLCVQNIELRQILRAFIHCIVVHTTILSYTQLQLCFHNVY